MFCKKIKKKEYNEKANEKTARAEAEGKSVAKRNNKNMMTALL